MTPKAKIICNLSALLVAFAFGYYMAPEKIKTIETEKSVKNEEEKKNSSTVTERKEITRPDGTKEVTEVTRTDTESNRKSKETLEKEKLKEVTKSGRKISINVLAGITTKKLPVYGVSASMSILGPISVGAFGLSNGIVGVSAGLIF